MKYTSKPKIIDAWPIADLLEAAKDGAAALPDEIRAAYVEGIIEFEVEHLTIATMEGVMVGRPGWMLIRGLEGEWYPCEDDIFVRSYQPLETVLGTEDAQP